MGGLFIIDAVFQHGGLYSYSVYVRLPVEIFCRVGIAGSCAWALVFNDRVKNQLAEKFPQGIGRFFARTE